MIFVGDIHANFSWYNEFMKNHKDSIQLGDFGIGFERYSDASLDQDLMINNNHQFLRGNHDDPNRLKDYKNYILDGSFDNTNSVFCIGGANSIDSYSRNEGIDWWKEEGLRKETFERIMDTISDEKPEIIASHDMPLDVYTMIHHPDIIIKTETNQMLSRIFNYYQPKIWVFGHHHQNIQSICKNTRFICVKNLDFIEI